MTEKKVAKKNYIYLTVVLLISLVLIVYFYMWYETYRENKLSIPIMSGSLQVINYNELDNYIIENKDAIVYVSVLKNENIRNFEERFNNYITSINNSNKILYLDITGELENSEIYNELIRKYTLRKKSIVDVPCLLSFKDGKLNSIYTINEKKNSMSEIKFFLNQEGIFE